MAKPLDDRDSDAKTPSGAGLEARIPAGTTPEFEAFYRDNFAVVGRAVGQVLTGADKETVVHEVFLRLMTNEQLRSRFHGGSLTAWLSTVARNHAIDYLRRRKLEQPSEAGEEFVGEVEDADQFERRAEARILVERFRQEHLPKKWGQVFELRFLQQLEQQQAAQKLGMSRTTLAYQEYRIRALLRRFLLKLENL
jgi:RNA polymerase sigma-70 factor (ECF subfamily)